MSPAPLISISLAVDPRFPPHCDQRAQSTSIAVLTVSLATAPITSSTWPTIFNLALAQRRDDLKCFDITSDASLCVNLTKGPKRPGFSRERGGHDNRFFLHLAA
ncbi:uncharacterized protein LDX57_009593 [Aspergillus melleus]|uniref:uncharacterized protein n=1 Tax=Aspergillus melleus TaxID=138277 RepID=UPI001E8CBE24|nr:uncharacterized protein LDX57_009593 [Aspergillus melleus]KAH8431944.1 hypothetical protein LDX57_009593 [Aspergillus melleus]